MKSISIVSPCYNEEENVETLYNQIKEIFKELKIYHYEHIFIDNCSQDNTVNILKKIAVSDKNLKIIVNERNFGWIRSPYHGLIQATSDAVIYLASDLQDPPTLIYDFIKKWEEGFKIVIGVKTRSMENLLIFVIRRIFYKVMKTISETEHISNFTGFGLYDQKFIHVLRTIKDPYPYLRGLVAELGFSKTTVEYTQPKREKGKSQSNFFRLYDVAMLGIVNHSKLPLRLASFLGFGLAIISFFVALIYLFYKLIYWDLFQLGLAPLVIGLFFFSSIQLIFIGVLGEYINAIFIQVKQRPLVIEKERINFDN